MKRALVLSLICVVGLAFAGFAQSLTGLWDTSVCLNPQTDSFAGAITLSSELDVTYAIGDWAFTSITVLGADGWVSQDFGVTGLFGLITVDSALSFLPLEADFGGWVTTLGLNMAGVSFGGTFYVGGYDPRTPLDPYDIMDDVVLVLSGTAGVGSAVVGSIDITLGQAGEFEDVCDFNFVDVTIGLDFTFCDCILVESEIYFTCEGFEYVEFCTTGIPIPNIPWLSFDACLLFELQTKELTISPVFDFGAYVCIDLYIYGDESLGATYPSSSFDFEAFSVEGIGFSCDIGGVTFGALSNWHTYSSTKYRPGLLYKKPFEIWEVYWISVGADACCGGVFEFDLAVFFNNSQTALDALFDVDSIEADMTVNVTEQFAFTMGLDIDVTGGFTEWCLGFEVTW